MTYIININDLLHLQIFKESPKSFFQYFEFYFHKYKMPERQTVTLQIYVSNNCFFQILFHGFEAPKRLKEI